MAKMIKSNISIKNVLHFWENGGIDLKSLQPPAKIDQIKKLEKALKINFPAEIKDLYLFSNGFKDGCKDGNGFRFLPAEEIISVSNFENGHHSFPNSDLFYLFIDYFDFSWGYAFKETEINSFSIYIVGAASINPIFIASSFSEFFQLYIDNDDSLYPD